MTIKRRYGGALIDARDASYSGEDLVFASGALVNTTMGSDDALHQLALVLHSMAENTPHTDGLDRSVLVYRRPGTVDRTTKALAREDGDADLREDLQLVKRKLEAGVDDGEAMPMATPVDQAGAVADELEALAQDRLVERKFMDHRAYLVYVVRELRTTGATIAGRSYYRANLPGLIAEARPDSENLNDFVDQIIDEGDCNE